VKPPQEATEEGCAEWQFTIVGHFIGQKLSYPAVNAMARRFWGAEGLLDVLSTENGFYFFKFSNGEEVDRVLEGGPWHFASRPIFLKRWKPNLTLLKEDPRRIPIWAKITGLPLEHWNPEGLSSIASGIGEPLYADRCTMERSRISFARVCVEVDATNELLREFDIEEHSGVRFPVRVVSYEWEPDLCTQCKCFGHSILCQEREPGEAKTGHPEAKYGSGMGGGE
jgi:hypothetical protein